MQSGTENLEIVLQFHIKFNIYIPNNPAITLLCIYPRKTKTYFHAKTCPQWYSIFIHNNLKPETTQIFINRFISQGIGYCNHEGWLDKSKIGRLSGRAGWKL